MTPEEPGKSGVKGKSIDIDDMKVEELKTELDRLGIDYPATAKKPELIELLKESE